MSAQGAPAGALAEVDGFHCPLSVDGSGRCHLFEAVVIRLAELEDPSVFKVRITCRFLVFENADASGSRCLLGTAKSRRDHLA